MVAMVLRQAAGRAGLQDGGRARMEQVERALALGKEAVQMDLEDGASWCGHLLRQIAHRISSLLFFFLAVGLGMSHLNLFFNVTQDKQDLLRALKAFDKAVSFLVSRFFFDSCLSDVVTLLGLVQNQRRRFASGSLLQPRSGSPIPGRGRKIHPGL
jgi:hypothetical protein